MTSDREVTAINDTPEDEEIGYERECPYFARYHRFEGHDPDATCAFRCVDEPTCVTGSWLTLAEFATVKAEFEREQNGSEKEDDD